ncbi:MAG: protein translocase subunit SecF [Candidatus Liptonbacteria bacterium CG11_big_fil_rev_8_21_14_0_20_35_14]|uniref:Protein-export membrane protein SecF n=1 Tax=Candidatus Liptonbacteria bacterium CG11_big_fil_rev_8_21_14_0_20_35_14 TaxID=1974634 RepID=A0A2H0N8C5_9BACT|nr:MAG: protein translocase subunit SecF [Candidatus Liptonbacteria bacterium CG11_big_fil_rev_8_21_14_0_20_35_14]
MFNFIKYKNIFLGLALILVVLSLVSIFTFGFKQGIDFVGGSLWQVRFDSEVVNSQAIRESLLKYGIEGISITSSSDRSYLLRFSEIGEDKHQEIASFLKADLGFFEELSFQSIGPSIGDELRRSAIWAIILVLIGISVFVALAFIKASYPVSSVSYGLITLITLFHDVIVPAGFLALMSKFYGVEVDTNFIVALLVIAGFSVHDTIVVFDRIRENLKNYRDKKGLSEIVNMSINETMARSINTSLTLIFVLIALLFAGPANLFYFVLVILIGSGLGTYSSIFVASPLLLVWHNFRRKK